MKIIRILTAEEMQQIKRQHPKRRISDDNPYRIYEDDNGNYYLEFTDGQGSTQHFQVDYELFNFFDCGELNDLQGINSAERHIERSVLSQEQLYERATILSESVEEIIIKNLLKEKLHTAIYSLPEMQRRRLIQYYFYGWSYKKIAKIERCSVQAVSKAILGAKKQMKKFFEKQG